MWQYQYYDESQYPDELQHYGVLGMKWGVRRARKRGVDYTYKSAATKRNEKRAEKHAEKGNVEKSKKYANRAKRSAEFDAKMQDSVEKSGAGKTTAKVLINGVFGAKTYEALKAAGANKYVALGGTQAALYVGGPLGAMGVTALARQNYILRDE